MLDNILNAISLFGENLNDNIVCGVIMVSAIIVAIGLLKPLLFNRIPNKHVRGSVIAFTNVAACFGTVFVYFLINGISFDYYVVASVTLSVCCIITYWLYEFTRLRNLIGLIGGIALRKVLKASLLAVTTDDINAVKQELKHTGTELKSYTKTEIKKASSKIKEDKDLKGL
jgi:hypothetical protein